MTVIISDRIRTRRWNSRRWFMTCERVKRLARAEVEDLYDFLDGAKSSLSWSFRLHPLERHRYG